MVLFLNCLYVVEEYVKQTGGIYLMVYSILSLMSIILLVIHEAVKYYPNRLASSVHQYIIFRCYTAKIGYNTLVSLCIMLSSCIAFERGLAVYFRCQYEFESVAIVLCNYISLCFCLRLCCTNARI